MTGYSCDLSFGASGNSQPGYRRTAKIVERHADNAGLLTSFFPLRPEAILSPGLAIRGQ
jgi:hypothetical protein